MDTPDFPSNNANSPSSDADQKQLVDMNFRNIRFFERSGGQWLLTCWFNERAP